MKSYLQKEESSYVKRIKLKKSIIKTHQILKTIATHEAQVNRFKPQRESYVAKNRQFSQKIKLLSQGKNIVLDPDHYKNQLIFNKCNKVNNFLKNYESTSIKEQTNRLCNIEVRRIVGDPSHKRQSTNSQTKMKSKKNQKLLHNQTSFTISVQKQRIIQQVQSQRLPNSYKSEIYTASSVQNRYSLKQNKSKDQKCFKPFSPTKKTKVYLYQRMAGTQNNQRDQTNYVYQKRIKSYLQFLWKGMLAHNIYLNLDLSNPQISFKKNKAFVGYGNNCNMIKGLIKRRYWWVISDEYNEDCLFIWTQIKVNKIFERQQKGTIGKSIYKQADEEDRRNLIKTSTTNRNRHTIQVNFFKSKEKTQTDSSKIKSLWNQKDIKILLPFQQKCKNLEERQKWGNMKLKEPSYLARTMQITEKYKQITILDDFSSLQQNLEEPHHNYYRVKPLVHNHLQNNFHLGNKKALFYNLQQYYRKVGEDLFHYVPLTFHIKNGFKDKQYKRFTQFYEKRAKLIKKEEQNQEHKLKTRNIWIVKPGENSNQGRGITVIDQIYQLNSIMKQGDKSGRNPKQQRNEKESQRTYIVQMYIDRPFLYNDRKFDIRHYMLITNLYGVTRAYWYQEGYIRTSSYHFNIHNFDPEIHLTNDAIQKHFPDYGKYQPSNKLSYTQFQNYLNTFTEKKYNFKQEIIPKMKKIAKDSVRSIYTKMTPKNQMNNFQIFGLDFMIDRSFKPWLIEINTNPCLDCVCPLLDRIIPYMVQQSLKLSLDLVYPPPHHYPNTAKHFAPLINLQTFKYELIFDSLSEGAELQCLYLNQNKNLLKQIGQIQEDEQFKDNGKQIKLQDFT